MYQIGNIYGITAIAVIGGGLFGFDISSMSAMYVQPAQSLINRTVINLSSLPTQQYRCFFNQGPNGPPFNSELCSGPSANVQGGITAAMPGGSFLGALVSGYLTDKLGRRRAIQIGCAIWIIGSIISCASQSIGMLIAGRFINGLSVGICSAQVPVYVSELAPPSKRGRVVGSQQWAITWGILIMYYISYGCSFMDGEKAFRVPWGLQMLPAVILAIGLIFLPESPRWLARHDRWEETQAVLTLVHGKGDPNSPFVKLEMDEIRQAIQIERQNADVSWLDLFKPNMINRLHIGVFTQIWSQLTGMNVMMCKYMFPISCIRSLTFGRLYHLRLRHGWSQRQYQPRRFFDPVHNKRYHDCPGPAFHGPLGPPSHVRHRRCSHDDLALRQRRSHGYLRTRCSSWWSQQHRRGVLGHWWCAFQGRHRLHISLRCLIRTNMGPGQLGVPA
jgi:sugar porter (SP) family MFS transporter